MQTYKNLFLTRNCMKFVKLWKFKTQLLLCVQYVCPFNILAIFWNYHLDKYKTEPLLSQKSNLNFKIRLNWLLRGHWIRLGLPCNLALRSSGTSQNTCCHAGHACCLFWDLAVPARECKQMQQSILPDQKRKQETELSTAFCTDHHCSNLMSFMLYCKENIYFLTSFMSIY